MEEKVTIKLVSLKEPCTACFIIGGLIRETLVKLQREYTGIDIEIIELEKLEQIYDIPGMEVEKLPAILINDVQVTAGSLPSKQQLITLITGGNA
jgi:hypothetical protein